MRVEVPLEDGQPKILCKMGFPKLIEEIPEEKKKLKNGNKKTRKRRKRKTRPDTRPIPVTDGWAGAEMRVFELSQLDHPYRPTDRRTKPLIESLVRD